MERVEYRKEEKQVSGKRWPRMKRTVMMQSIGEAAIKAEERITGGDRAE